MIKEKIIKISVAEIFSLKPEYLKFLVFWKISYLFIKTKETMEI